LSFSTFPEVGMKELSEVPGPLASKAEQRPGAYQSRIFTFLNRQANRLRDGIAQGLRQVRVSVQLTGQILLMPLRLLSRWKIRSGSQLPGKSSAALPLVAEQPTVAIERILAEVSAAGYGQLATTEPSTPIYEDWSAIDEQDWDTSLLSKNQRSLTGPTVAAPTLTQPIIRGLASRLSDRSLVLVDRNNKLLDVLSPSQQLHIRQRIDPQLTSLSEAKSGSGAMQQGSASGSATALPYRGGDFRAISSAGDFQLLGAAGSEADHPKTFGTPAISTKPWHQLSHWFNFYREYFRVELAEPAAEESDDPLIAPKLLQSAAGTLTTLQVSAIVPSQTPAASLVTEPPSRGIVLSDAPQGLGKKNIGDRVFQPEWIEAPTRPLGYERSWLVRCLEWLDSLVLAIENWVLGWYRRLFG
jgi:hypothetical protein